MKTIYLDSKTYQCYLSQDKDNTRIPYKTEDFDDKCEEYILGFRIIPAGYTWERSDGHVFTGEMISAWKNYSELDSAQRAYEKQLITEYKTELTEYENELAELDALVLEYQYNNLVEGL